MRTNPPDPPTRPSAAPVRPTARQRPGTPTKTKAGPPRWPRQGKRPAGCQPATARRPGPVLSSHARPAPARLRRSLPARPAPSGPPARRLAAPQLTPRRVVGDSMSGIVEYLPAWPVDGRGTGRSSSALPGPSPSSCAGLGRERELPHGKRRSHGPRALPAHATRLCGASESGQENVKPRLGFIHGTRTARAARSLDIAGAKPPRLPALTDIEYEFDYLYMDSSDSGHISYAQIAAAATRYLQGCRFTGEEEAAAVAELAEAAAGRADLLAERAGTALGFSQGGLEPARNRQIAELCIAAGADQALMGRWIAVGRDLAARAAIMPCCRAGR
jgi:hypothetical protein